MATAPPKLTDEDTLGYTDDGTTSTPTTTTGLRRRRRSAANRDGKVSFPVEEPRIMNADHSDHGTDETTSGGGVGEESSNSQAFVPSLIGAMRPSKNSSQHDMVIQTLDRHFKYVAGGILCTWASIVVMVYSVMPSGSFRRLEGLERNSAIVACCLIAVPLLSRILPIFGIFGSGRAPWASGVWMGALAVQVVACLTDFLMAFFPSPVLVDPVLGTHVHLLRWCEWCPCAFCMTFLMEGCDLHWEGGDNLPRNFIRDKYVFAATQGGACVFGLIFPFLNPAAWYLAMCVSCMLYLQNYPRLAERTRSIPASIKEGASVEELERYNAAKLALRLRRLTIFVWSSIVTVFFAGGLGPKYASAGSIFANPSINMVAESFFDVVSKVFFMGIIVDINRAIFDPFTRAERRLEELRMLMVAVWESSSDVIAISVQNGQGVSVMLSPHVYNLRQGMTQKPKESAKRTKNSIVYQLSQDAFLAGPREKDTKDGNPSDDMALEEEQPQEPLVRPEMISDIGSLSFLSMREARNVKGDEVAEIDETVLRALSDVVVKAWSPSSDQDTIFRHTLHWTSSLSGDENTIRSEAKVNRIDKNAVIVVIRDISARVRAFETEKQMLYETTSRRKDAEANRFTSHEVKNGLLAAIGLYESLCDVQRGQLAKDQLNTGEQSIAIASEQGLGLDSHDSTSDDIVRCMTELGKSLHQTLDTILIEAMTRDLVHDLYRPYKEVVNLAAALSGFDGDGVGGSRLGRNLTRFPLITRPSPLPTFHMDPNLIRYLHRQALSNACKYGKVAGTVLTEIIYQEDDECLTVNVINLPGKFHHQLLALGKKAEKNVFEKGQQMHSTFESELGSTNISKRSETAALPGDGGWIIHKCAKLMKGTCSISFQETRTVISVKLPARPFGANRITRKAYDIKAFKLPEKTWGIAIDDSKVQMKLLSKFFEFAGIPKDRIKVFGKSSKEVLTFVDFVVHFMDENMGDPVLLIADENLDITDEASKHVTISGSQLVETIRKRLLQEQEKQLVSLIRSANDSSSDVAIYNARAHGFLPKAPIKKGNVLETLAPLWISRYPESQEEISFSGTSCGESVSSDSLESASFASLNDDDLVTSPIEILNRVNEVDTIFAMGSPLENFRLIKDKLHLLKGDLLTLPQMGSKVIGAIGMINSFRQLDTDQQLSAQWTILKDMISSWWPREN
mmetsp:Transcript_13182/g.28675  ORF Transcript_13182/g.28675 Transcript_13182/m.28675 type:complete len:1190 (+) Transcript_13182:134-3703(+)